MKQVLVIREVLVNGQEIEEETRFSSDVMPMAIHFAESWARRNGYKLVKSPKKQATMFNPCRVAVSKSEKIFYAIR